MNKSPPALFFQTKALRSLGEIIRRCSFFDGGRGDERENQCAVPGLQIALLFNDNQAVPPSSFAVPVLLAMEMQGKARKTKMKMEVGDTIR